MPVQSFKELDVWKLAIKQCVEVYRVTKHLPSEEKYGLMSQMRRAAVSVPANIAEGFVRRHTKENLHFLSMAQGSNAELETHYTLCEELGFLTTEQLCEVRSVNEHVGKKITRYYQTLNER